MIEKLLLKRCSTEVQLMLTRMKERPEDFDYGTGWRMLVEQVGDDKVPYSRIERMMILKYWKECRRVRSRKELLERIMSETINPSPNKREQLENELSKHYTRSLAASMASTQQALTSGILSAYNDPRAMYGSSLQGAIGRQP